MLKNSVVKIVSFVLSVFILLSSCTVFAFAKSHAYFTITDNLWRLPNANDYPQNPYQTYPDLNDKNWDSSVYSHSGMNGKICFANYLDENWTDKEYSTVQDYLFKFPAFPDSYLYHAVLRSDDSYFLFCWSDPLLKLKFDNGLLYYNTEIETELYSYSLSYPYTNWIQSETFYCYDLYTDVKVSDRQYSELTYSEVNIGSRPADTFVLQDKQFNIKFNRPVLTLVTSFYTTLHSIDLNKLKTGLNIIIPVDVGFIPVTDCNVFLLKARLTFLVNGVVSESSPYWYVYLYDTWVDENNKKINVGNLELISNSKSPAEWEIIDYDDSVSIMIECTIVSDAELYYFPGTVNFYEVAAYDSDVKHDEIINSIQSVSDNISSAITTQTDSINNTINSAVVTVSDNFKSTLENIFTSDTGVPDVVFDDKGLGSGIEDENKIVDDLNAQIDSVRDSYLADLGYSDYGSFLQSNVNQLDSKFSYAFLEVRTLFDEIVSAADITILIVFSLGFGLCIYILGRRLS